jgi:hypothetical protein
MKKIKAKCFCCGKDFMQEYDEKKDSIGEDAMFVCEDPACLAKFHKLEDAVE